MNNRTKDQIKEILMAIYQIPGEFFIGGAASIGIGQAMLSFTNLGIILILFGIFLFILEIISPIIAGIELYEKALKNVKRLFKQFFN
ncbi:MAG: hypothetical protein ACFFG0_51630 [Candidatus Thorarchaeota archaeon]